MQRRPHRLLEVVVLEVRAARREQSSGRDPDRDAWEQIFWVKARRAWVRMLRMFPRAIRLWGARGRQELGGTRPALLKRKTALGLLLAGGRSGDANHWLGNSKR